MCYTDKVLGLQPTWLFLRVFLFLLLATGIALALSFLNLTPTYGIIFGGLLAAIPLTVLLFECNFSRQLSIFDVIVIFILGGLLSLLVTLITCITTGNDFVDTVVMAPVFEELAKALIVIMLIRRYKPKDVLTGLLIGFAVGAGFTVFEH